METLHWKMLRMCPRRSAFKPEDAGDQVDMLGGSSVDRGWWAVVNQSKGSKSIQGTYKVSQKYSPKLRAFMKLNQAQNGNTYDLEDQKWSKVTKNGLK